MLTLNEARALALDEMFDPAIHPAIIDAATIAKPYGWVFFYNSRELLETRNISFALGGNGPIIVEHNGRTHSLGSGKSPEDTISEFESKRWWRFW